MYRLACHVAILVLLSVTLASVTESATGATSRNMELLAHLDQHGGGAYSSCCNYVHHDGREYVALGAYTGTSIVDVTNPLSAREVAFIPGPQTDVREMKQYRDRLYVTAENPSAGIQIIRMSDPEHPTLAGVFYGTFRGGHSIQVDTTRALLYVPLASSPTTLGVRIFTLADPEHPMEIGSYTGSDLHDILPDGNRLFGFALGSRKIVVLDVTDPSAPVEISRWTYPGASPHSGALSADRSTLYVCDEVTFDRTTKVFDIRDLSNPRLLSRFQLTADPLASVHKPYVRDADLCVSHYTAGARVYDIADPATPAEFAFFDTYPGLEVSFNGTFQVAPYFPSGTIAVSDRQTGLYLLRASRRYGSVKLQVIDDAGTPVEGADVVVTRDGVPVDSTRTELLGAARFALDPGAYEIRVRHYPLSPEKVLAFASVGSRDSIAVRLRDLPRASLTGRVRRAADLTGIPDATVEVLGTPLRAVTAPDGSFILEGIPSGEHRVQCDRPGFVLQVRSVELEPSEENDLGFRLLAPAWYDGCEEDRGWSLADATDNATTGRWIREAPVMTGSEPCPTQPGEDHTPEPGTRGFVTGNTPEPTTRVNEQDVDGGTTSLTSPALAVSGMADPTLTFWYWFTTPSGFANQQRLRISVAADDGPWVMARAIGQYTCEWTRESIRLRDYLSPATSVRVRVVAEDPTPETIIEAAVDDIELHDGAIAPPVDALRAGVDIRPSSCPNPLNPRAGGVLPVAVHWVEQHRLDEIDPSSATLEGVRAARAVPPSTGAAASGPTVDEACECGGAPDPGMAHWLFLFPVPELAAALPPSRAGEMRSLRFSARLRDGSGVEGHDCVTLVGGAPRGADALSLRRAGTAARGNDIEFEVIASVSGARAVVTIFSVTGRLVRRIESVSGPGGRGVVRWDGRDGSGRAVSPGVYFVRADVSGARATRRVVLLP